MAQSTREIMTHRGVAPQQVMNSTPAQSGPPDPNAAVKAQAAQIQTGLSSNAIAGLEADFDKFRHGNVTWEEFLVGAKSRGSETSGHLYNKFLSEAKATIAHIDREMQEIISRSKEIGDVRVCNRDSSIASTGPADKLFAVMCAVSDFQGKVRRYSDDIASGSYSGTAEISGKAARPLDIESLSEIIAQLGKDQREIDDMKGFIPSRQEIIDYRREHKFPADQPLLREADIPKKNKWPKGAILTRDVSQELTMKYGFPTTDESVSLREVAVSSAKPAPSSVEITPGLRVPVKTVPTATSPTAPSTASGRGKAVAIVIGIVVVLIIAVILYFVVSGGFGEPAGAVGAERFTTIHVNPPQGARTERADVDGPNVPTMPGAGFDIIEMGRAAGMDMPGMMVDINRANEKANSDAVRGKDDKQMRTLMGADARMENSHGAKEHFADCPCGCNNI